jgi:hypothetical protein
VRSGRLAHRILAMVVPGDRAAAIAGDLIESADTRGPRWYWLSLVRVVCAVLWQDAMRTPVHIAAFAAVTWLVYMVVTAVTMFLALFASVIGWSIAYIFANHTGVELLTDWLGVRVEWGAPSSEAVWLVEMLMLTAVAPFHTGRLAARWWPGRELTIALVMSLVWPVMSLVAPLSVSHVATSAQLVPVIVTCMFLGAVWARLRTTPLDPPDGLKPR